MMPFKKRGVPDIISDVSPVDSCDDAFMALPVGSGPASCENLDSPIPLHSPIGEDTPQKPGSPATPMMLQTGVSEYVLEETPRKLESPIGLLDPVEGRPTKKAINCNASPPAPDIALDPVEGRPTKKAKKNPTCIIFPESTYSARKKGAGNQSPTDVTSDDCDVCVVKPRDRRDGPECVESNVVRSGVIPTVFRRSGRHRTAQEISLMIQTKTGCARAAFGRKKVVEVLSNCGSQGVAEVVQVPSPALDDPRCEDPSQLDNNQMLVAVLPASRTNPSGVRAGFRRKQGIDAPLSKSVGAGRCDGTGVVAMKGDKTIQTNIPVEASLLEPSEVLSKFGGQRVVEVVEVSSPALDDPRCGNPSQLKEYKMPDAALPASRMNPSGARAAFRRKKAIDAPLSTSIGVGKCDGAGVVAMPSNQCLVIKEDPLKSNPINMVDKVPLPSLQEDAIKKAVQILSGAFLEETIKHVVDILSASFKKEPITIASPPAVFASSSRKFRPFGSKTKPTVGHPDEGAIVAGFDLLMDELCDQGKLIGISTETNSITKESTSENKTPIGAGSPGGIISEVLESAPCLIGCAEASKVKVRIIGTVAEHLPTPVGPPTVLFPLGSLDGILSVETADGDQKRQKVSLICKEPDGSGSASISMDVRISREAEWGREDEDWHWIDEGGREGGEEEEREHDECVEPEEIQAENALEIALRKAVSNVEAMFL